MTLYRVKVLREDGTYVGRVLERPGVTTEGETLDELVLMVRDAIELLWQERDVQLELILGSDVSVSVAEDVREAGAAVAA